jgi:dynein heavy chain
MLFLYAGVRLPLTTRSMFSYFVDLETGSFVRWDCLVPSTESLIARDPTFYVDDSMMSYGKKTAKDSGVITTVDSVRYSFLAGLLLLNKRPVLLAGESSCVDNLIDFILSGLSGLRNVDPLMNSIGR